MSVTITLHATQAQFEQLWEQEDRPRASARSVTVDRAALLAVLMDHQQLIDRLRAQIEWKKP